MNHSQPPPEAGQLVQQRRARASRTASSGISPTIERIRSGMRAAVRQCAARRRRTRPRRPTGRGHRRRAGGRRSSRARCRGSAPRTCWRRPRRPGSSRASSSAIASMLSAVHRHPARAVRLLEVPAGRQRRAAIEDADVVEAEEAALEDVHALRRPCGSPTR